MKLKVLYFKLSEKKISRDIQIYGQILKQCLLKGKLIAFHPHVKREEGLKSMSKSSILKNEKKEIEPKINKRKETVKNKNYQIENKTNNQ